MFQEISKTVAKFFVILIICLVAFAFGFHIMLHDELRVENDGSLEPNLTEGPFGNGFGWSFLKTYVMMIGEFEYEGIGLFDKKVKKNYKFYRSHRP